MAGVQVIALLRGINLGGRHRVSMGDLRTWLTDAGFVDVRTVLQSGNVVLTCDPRRVDMLADQITSLVADHLGFAPEVVTRTPSQLEAVRACDPFGAQADDPARYLVGFLQGSPGADAPGRVAALGVGEEAIRLIGREIYAWCPDGVQQASWARAPWDAVVSTPVTVRNWRTLERLMAATRR